MQKIATAKEMQAIDQRAIQEYGIPGIVLMENAGLGVVKLLVEKFSDLARKKVLVICGKGNNGGDGFVIARHLFNRGVEVEVVLLGKRSQLKQDAKTNADAAFQIGVPIKEVDENNLDRCLHTLRHCHIIIDAIFGTGLDSPVTGWLERVIEKINKAEKFVIGVDIASGLESDSGKIIGPHIHTDLTVALGLMKRSHLLYPATEAMGEVRVVNISMPQKAVEEQNITVNLLEEEDIRSLFKKREPNTHKGDYGHTLVIGGSRGKGGAAGLAAMAALRMGAGLVTLAVPQGCYHSLEFNPLEVMTLSLPETKSGSIDVAAKDLILEHCRGKSAVALGPGITTEPETLQMMEAVLPGIECPMVIDADGLNCLAASKTLLSKLTPNTVLTPHPREMSRISGVDTQAIQEDRIGSALDFARKHRVVVVLKGARSVIAVPDGSVYINPTGNPGMATAGSGDVLTGVIAGLISQGFSSTSAAYAGTYIHGLAGDDYASENSETSLIAGDLLRTLPASLKRILP